MEQLKNFLKGKPLWIKIIILIALGVIIFFSIDGCSLYAEGIHVDKINHSLGVKDGFGN